MSFQNDHADEKLNAESIEKNFLNDEKCMEMFQDRNRQ